MSSFVSALAVRLRVASNPGTRAVAVYLALVPASTFTSTVVGSLSEYRSAPSLPLNDPWAHGVTFRFPHPLLTTTLHLAISLSTLLALALAAKIALRSSFSRRQLSTKSTSAPTSSPLLTDVLTALSSHLPSRSITTRHLAESLTPFILSSSLAAVLASLVELRAARIAEPPFWTLARLLPLVITAAAGAFSPTDTPGALEDVNAPNVVVGVLVWLVLMAGPAVGWRASGEGWVCGVVYAVAVVGWVLSVKGGMKEGEEVGQDGEPKSVLFSLRSKCREGAADLGVLKVVANDRPVSHHRPLPPLPPTPHVRRTQARLPVWAFWILHRSRVLAAGARYGVVWPCEPCELLVPHQGPSCRPGHAVQYTHTSVRNHSTLIP